MGSPEWERERLKNRSTIESRSRPPEHNPNKEYCGAKKVDGSGDRCANEAGYGTDHLGIGACKHHGGSTESGKKHAARLLATRTMGAYGAGEVDVEPHEAILWCVRMAAHEVKYISDACSRAAVEIIEDEMQDDPNHFATRKLQALVAERAKSMDRLAKYAKSALDAGVAERQVRIAEGYGQLLAGMIGAVLNDLELSTSQRRAAPHIVQRRLLELETGQLGNTIEGSLIEVKRK